MIPSVNAQNWSEEEKTAKKAHIKLFSVHVALPRHHLCGPLLGYRRQQVSQHGTSHHTNAFRLVATKPPPIYVIGFMKLVIRQFGCHIYDMCSRACRLALGQPCISSPSLCLSRNTRDYFLHCMNAVKYTRGSRGCSGKSTRQQKIFVIFMTGVNYDGLNSR